MNVMSILGHLTESEAWRVDSRLEGGQAEAEVAEATGVSHSAGKRVTRNNPAFVQGNVRFGGGEIVVYASVLIDRRTIRFGALTGRRYRNPTNGLSNAFTEQEPNRTYLGHSRQISVWPPTAPQPLLELESALLEESDRIPSSSSIDSLTPYLKSVRVCWP
ncbi:hypothetical protein TNCT_639661 [Trichonephila clavata]|uniref:Uncharacterized protein n=1 Tax=Trichonephila clavata TaxID=2740835 RepID=A0A8X6I3K2_TRICU|nr:hypothetical protein TNCT_639661 [Trichonephila clavata]